MASWARPGVKVVCMDSAPKKIPHVDGVRRFRPEWTPPAVGQVYTIKSVFVSSYGEVGLYLEEIDTGIFANSGKSLSYDISRFRPLVTKTQEEDVAMFKRIADDVPTLEPIT